MSLIGHIASKNVSRGAAAPFPRAAVVAATASGDVINISTFFSLPLSHPPLRRISTPAHGFHQVCKLFSSGTKRDVIPTICVFIIKQLREKTRAELIVRFLPYGFTLIPFALVEFRSRA